MRIIFRVCERIQVLDYGKTIAVGTPEEIRTDQASRGRLPRREAERSSAAELTDLSVHYGRVAAVNDLSLEVKQGELVGLVGHNGAGKSTTLLVDHRRPAGPRAGQITFEGELDRRRVARRDPPARDRARSGGPPHLRPAHASARTCSIGTSARRDRRAGDEPTSSRCRALPGARALLDRSPGAKLSGGEQQQLAIARALLARPQAPPARRADARPRSADRRPGLRDPRRSCRRKA